MGNFFSLGSRVCIGILNPAVLAPHRLSLSLVTYLPLAVTPQVSTNLGPVARLEGATRARVVRAMTARASAARAARATRMMRATRATRATRAMRAMRATRATRGTRARAARAVRARGTGQGRGRQ